MLATASRRAAAALGLAPALLAGALAAAPADAAKQQRPREVRYQLEYSAWGSYAFHEHRAFGGDTADERYDFEITAAGDVDVVTFRNGAPLDVALADRTEGLVGGEFLGWYQFEDGSSLQAACAVSPGLDAAAGMTRLGEVGELARLDGEVELALRPFDRLDVSMTCGDRGTAATTLLNDAEPLGEGPFDLRFTLPRDIVGMGTIEQLVGERTISGAACPGVRQGGEATCTLHWQGRVRLRRIKGGRTAKGSTGAPIPAAPTAPGAPTSPGAAGSVLRGVSAKDVRVAPSGRTVTVKVACRADCTGAIVVAPGSQRPFTLRGGRARRVTVRLDRSTRQAVRSDGRATVHIAAVAGDRTETKTLTVRARRG